MKIFIVLIGISYGLPMSPDKSPSWVDRVASSVTEAQVVVGVIIGGIAMLVMVLVVVDLMTFSYAHQKRQKVLLTQLTDILTELAALHDCQYIQKNGKLPDRIKTALSSIRQEKGDEETM